MDIVARPELYPGHCIATLKGEDPNGFIDVGITPAVMDPKVYVSVSWVQECARKLGFLDPVAAAALQEQVESLEVEIGRLEDELADADKFQEAVHVLKRHGLNPQKKPGRKPAKAA